MPITPFLRNQAFDPEAIQVMSSAFTKACATLGLADRSDPITALLALHIIKAAQRGIKTDAALYSSAMQEFKSGPQ